MNIVHVRPPRPCSSTALNRFVYSEVDPFNLPFPEAIDYWKGKVTNLPTEKWTDLLREAHAKAFVVAGAMKDDLLADLHGEVEKAITTGTTLQDFRKNFREIVKKHGWSYKGDEAWRTKVIYTTNMATAYSAGRYQQMTDPDVLKSRPYFRYRHNYSGVAMDPRPEHQSWDNVILPADDPWWNSHFTPNGWGCHCGVESVTAAQASTISGVPSTNLNSDLPRPANENKTVSWKNPSTGQTEQIPWGISPGWDYNPGKSFPRFDRMGKSPDCSWFFNTDMSQYAEEGGRNCVKSIDTQPTWRILGLPKIQEVGKEYLTKTPETIPAAEGENAISEAHKLIAKALGVSEAKPLRILKTPVEEIAIHYEMLSHIGEKRKDHRETYANFVELTLSDPLEVWATLYDDNTIRHRYLALFDMGKRSILCIVRRNSDHSILYNVMNNDWAGINRQRQGILLYKKWEDQK